MGKYDKLKGNMTADEFKKDIERAFALLQKQGKIPSLPMPEVEVEVPEDPEHGDYATSIALRLSKVLGKDAKETAFLIADTLSFPVEIAGPGFLNVRVPDKDLIFTMGDIVKKKGTYGFSAARKRKVIVEFTDPNPFKEFHIGHLYSNAVGESLSRLFEAMGDEVRRVNYQGDVGLHVAKAVWGMQERMREQSISFQELESKSPSERMRFLGVSYAVGDKAYREGTAKKEIEALNLKIFAKDKSVKELYEKGRKWSLEYFEKLYKLLGTKFDHYYFESEVGKVGAKLVEEGLKKGIFEQSQGAVIFPGEKYGLHSRVFINSQGLPTYEAKELGLAPTKYKDFKYDASYIITGNEVVEYFKVLLTALREVNPELGAKTEHIAHGMVRLPEGKMSSRSGNVVTAEQMVGEVQSRVRDMMKSSGSEVPLEHQEATAGAIAVGAIKYSLLRVGLGRDIAFDFEKSLSLEGASGPYIQYTYARCRSILRESKLHLTTLVPDELSLPERRVLRILHRFPEVVKEASQKLSPSMVCAFVFELAHAYNNFYGTHRVLQADTKEQQEFRLCLTAATSQVLKTSLFLLGIESPERM